MAKDDYFVIVYKILAYLYDCLKNGKEPEAADLRHDGRLFRLHPQYWLYIMEHLQDGGYMEGLRITKTWGKETLVDDFDRCRITPEGIAYLVDNSMLQRVKKALKELKEIVPGV